IERMLPVRLASIFEKIHAFSASVGVDLPLEVTLSSKGGDVDGALAAGRLLRKERVTISVPNDDECLSACVFLLMAGVQRMVTGKVAIHRPYSIETSGMLAQLTTV